MKTIDTKAILKAIGKRKTPVGRKFIAEKLGRSWHCLIKVMPRLVREGLVREVTPGAYLVA